jgi:hypothetical protein
LTVLFYVPVTKSFIEQQVLSLALNCGASERDIVAHYADTFDYSISVGTVHNILHRNILKAEKIHKNENLSDIKIGAHDEIFQNNKPILVGCDVASSFIYLLSLENSRDGDTWGVRLLECNDQGLTLDYSVADGGTGLRAGQAAAFPDTPCNGDLFHALNEVSKEVSYQENKAFGRLNEVYSLKSKMKAAKKKKKGNSLSAKLRKARANLDQRLYIADTIATISQWLKEDVLSIIGPDLETRRMLFDFLIEELQKLEAFSEHIKKGKMSAAKSTR